MKNASVKFWGVRGSIPVPGPETLRTGGNTSCVEVRADGEIIILDAGTGIRPLGLSLAKEFNGVPLNLTLLISHTHWDHIQGFPFFLPAYNPANKLHIRGYEGARAKFSHILSAQMESPYFPVEMVGLPANIDVEELKTFEFSVGKIQVKARLMNHPGVCAGYRLETSAGSIAYLPDTEPQLDMRQALQAAGKPQTAEALERAKREDSALVEFIRGVDVLMIDSQYTPEEYRTHIGWGHSSALTVTRFAVEAQVKRLFLFHHDPSHDDHQIDLLVKETRKLAHGSGLVVDAAREGAVVEL